MKPKSQLPQLAKLAAALRDKALLDLSTASETKSATERLIRAFGDQPGPWTDQTVLSHMIGEAHESWRQQRRARLNQQLARDSARFLDAQQKAASAFGRAVVLSKLSRKE